MSKKPTILILCTGNSARSQMAEGILDRIGNGKYAVYSAGTSPSFVRPEAISVLAEIGIDISENRSKSVDEFTNFEMDYVLTVCDNALEHCPIFPATVKRVHHSFDDPAAVEGSEETRMTAFRRARDEIHAYLEHEFVRDVLGD